MSHWQGILFSLHRWICIRSSPINWKHGGSHSLKPTLIIADVKTSNIHVRLSSSTARSGADLILLGFELHCVCCFVLRLISDFFAPFLNRPLISDYLGRVRSPDGAARIFSELLCRGVFWTHGSRVPPDWHLWSTLYRLSYSAAAQIRLLKKLA